MTPQEMQEKAMDLFTNRLHCSQAVLSVALEKLGKKNDDLVKAMDPFGGGISAHGDVCGAVVGGLAAIGLLFGRDKGGAEADVTMWIYSRELIRRFRKDIAEGNLYCRDIIQVDWSDLNQVKAFRTGEKYIYCRTLVGKTAHLVGELMERALA